MRSAKSIPWSANGPTVIGIVRNASTTAVGDSRPLEYFEPLIQSEAPDSVLLLRVGGKPEDSVPVLQDAVRAFDHRLQRAVQPLTELYDREVDGFTRAFAAISILSAVSVMLSAIGLAGLAGYTVAQRTRELGIRLALGARPAQIVLAVLQPMSVPIAAGFALGSAGQRRSD